MTEITENGIERLFELIDKAETEKLSVKELVQLRALCVVMNRKLIDHIDWCDKELNEK